MPVGAHEHTGFVFRQRNPLRAFGLNSDVPALLCSIHFAIGQSGNVSKCVLRLSQRASNLLGHTDNQIWLTVQEDGFSQGVNPQKESFHQVDADESQFRAVLVVDIADSASERDLNRVQLRHASSHSPDQYVLHLLVLVFRLAGSTIQDKSHGLGQPHVVAHILVVFPGDGFVAPLQFDELLLAGNDGILADQKNVCPEVGYPVGNIDVRPTDH